LTLLATKLALLRIRDATTPPDSNDLVKMCYLSDDFREGIEAFLGKRKPDWQGR
jgi:enoyl-CoA hydratase